MRNKLGGLAGRHGEGARDQGFTSGQVARLSGATKNYLGLIVEQCDVNQLEELPSVTVDQPIGVSLTTVGSKPTFKFSYSS